LGSIVSALPLHPGAEVTAEANPGTVTEAKLEALRAAGINRLSLGIQTFQPKHARLLNRGHTVRQARELIAMVRRGGFDSWSVDIIFGLPEQTLAEFHQDLEAILETEPPHVSLYGLTFEPGTPLTRARDAGGIHALDPDTWHAMYEAACTALRAGGWERYEISNFARPGHRAQHNDAVWRGAHYAGLGPGAHGFLPDGRRTRNADKLEDWLASPAGEIELPSPKQHALDMVLTTLRHIDGLDLQALAQTGHPLPEDALTPLRDHGLVQLTGARVQLTDAGVWVADAVIRHLTDALSS
jgi:oxygen-independent coproporphyrinogen-3 oxidase